MKRLHFAIQGMSCAACVAHVERAVRSVVGDSADFTVSLLTNSLSVLPKREISDTEADALTERLEAAVRAAGYRLLTEAPTDTVQDRESRMRLLKLILSAFLTLGVMYLSMGGMLGLPIPAPLTGVDGGLFMALSQLLLTLPVVILNFKFFKNGFSALLHRAPNMDSLIAVGAGAALLYGIFAIVMIANAAGNDDIIHAWVHDLYFESAAMILTLVSLGKMLESRAKDKASEAVRSLARLSPKFATLLRDGKECSVPLSEIRVGDLLLIRAGELIAVDGEVVSGTGSADESALTGESMPVEKEVGSTVRAACVLLTGALTIRATEVGEDTSLARIIRLLEDAAASKAPIARIADRVSAVFVPCVMAISALTLILWLLLTQNVEHALRSAISVLVISCPCALGLATPTAITVGIGRAAKSGILFRNAESLEKLCTVKTVVFDKTGTLTEGKPAVTTLIAYEQSPRRVLELAAAVERLSSHPLAPAVSEAAERLLCESGESCRLLDVRDFEALVGRGAVGTVEDTRCFVGKPDAAFLDAVRAALPTDPTLLCDGICEKDDTSSIFSDFAALESRGMTVVTVSFDSTVVALIAIADRIRSDSREAISLLHARGVDALMLTGDNERTAEAIAESAALDGFYAGLLPEDKERMVRRISEQAPCAMVGDGINDSPALVRADVGIAIGTGTETAIDSADVVLSRPSLLGVAEAFGISHATIRVIRQNLFWALFYNAVCIPVAAGLFYPLLGWQLSPMLASAAMSCSSVFVVLNALRLRSLPIHEKKRVRGENSNASEQNLISKGDQEDMLFQTEKTYVLHVEGMMCPRCVAHVKTALEGVKGVKKAEVDLDSKTATVTATLKDDSALCKAVVDAGYEIVK